MSAQPRFDPTVMDRCNYLLCERQAAIACPDCGWTYCGQHWDRRMHAVHERGHAAARQRHERRLQRVGRR